MNYIGAFSRHVRYWWLKARYREAAAFTSMGLGIEARYERCQQAWAPHLRCSREFVARQLVGRSFETIAVLGAGRLYDIDLGELLRYARKVELYDADPGAYQSFQRSQLPERFEGRVNFHLTELTASLRSWSKTVTELLQTAPTPQELVTCLTKLALQRHELPKVDCIISMNLMSQIPLYWRDFLIDALQNFRELRADENGEFPEPIRAAVRASLALLQEQHREQLRLGAKQQVILVSDLEWLYYQKEYTQMQSEKALDQAELSLQGYIPVAFDTWWWHIAPQGIEHADYGVIHRVAAVSLCVAT